MTKLALALLVALAGTAAADDGSDLVYGGGVSFMVTAPTGWEFSPIGQSHGFDALYMAKGKTDEVSFKHFEAAIYARAEANAHDSLATITNRMIESARAQGPIRVLDKPAAWTCGANKSGRRVMLLAETGGNVATVIYLSEPGAVVTLGMFADSEAHARAAMPKLAELCASYHFVGKVTTPRAARH